MKKAVSIGIYSTLWISFLIWSVLCVSKVTSLPEDPNEVVQKDEKTDNDYKQEVEIAALQHKEISKEEKIKSKEGNNELTIASNRLQFGFVHAFIASLSVIIVSEIGDKTFFIAAIMAMKYSRLLVFAGAISALGLMTFLSVCLGYTTIIIPRWVTFYICTLLLVIFGLKMLYEGWNMSPEEAQEEFEEVSAELKKKEDMQNAPTDPEQGQLSTQPSLYRRFRCLACFAPIFIQAFTLTFLAEWGDRSQFTTIVLSAREDPVGVTLGGTLGHALCTALAVLGGKIIAQRISVRTVTLIGGVVFLLFAVTAFLHDPNSEVAVS